jgi:hypothetical protein
MGKLLNNSDIVMRTGKVAFYKCRGESIYRRMEGFTEITNSKGTKEYTRQYVDEDFERTDVSGYSPEKSYSFDRYRNNAVLDDIIYITENELIGQAMVREILVIDMTTVSNSGNTGSDTVASAVGKLRKWAVIPDTDGDTTDCLTYSGTFKCRGEMTEVIATSSDDWQTITEVTESSVSQIPYMDIIVTDYSGKTIGTLSTKTSHENLSVETDSTAFTIKAGATISGATLTLVTDSGVVDTSGVGTLEVTKATNSVTNSLKYTLICAFRDKNTSVSITVTRTFATSTSLDEED